MRFLEWLEDHPLPSTRELQVEDLEFDGPAVVEIVDDRLKRHAAAAVLLEVFGMLAQTKADALQYRPVLAERGLEVVLLTADAARLGGKVDPAGGESGFGVALAERAQPEDRFGGRERHFRQVHLRIDSQLRNQISPGEPVVGYVDERFRESLDAVRIDSQTAAIACPPWETRCSLQASRAEAKSKCLILRPEPCPSPLFNEMRIVGR